MSMNQKLSHFKEMFRGSSFPTLGETTDGSSIIVKMKGAGNGVTALLTEFLVNKLANAAYIPVPNASVVHIARGFSWSFGTDEFHDLVMKSDGPNLALQWLGPTVRVPASRYQFLPKDIISQVVTIDLVFSNFDRSDLSGNLLEDERGRFWIVDHGSCRFLFRPDEKPVATLPSGHIFSGREDAFDSRWLELITPALIAEVIAELPEEWLRESQFTREYIFQQLNARLRVCG